MSAWMLGLCLVYSGQADRIFSVRLPEDKDLFPDAARPALTTGPHSE